MVRLHTDWPLLSLSAEDFVREILVKRIHPSYIVEGPDFGFGRGRQGNVEMLESLSARGGFRVHVVEPYQLVHEGQSITVSSTLTRERLRAGNVAGARQLLGRSYALFGRIVHGEAEGRKLGFPTINLELGDQLVPGEGVYAGVSEIEGRRHRAAISVGHRPTLGGAQLVVEAFLLDEAHDLYLKEARIEFDAFIRRQQRFDSREALSRQIEADVAQVREAITPERLTESHADAN